MGFRCCGSKGKDVAASNVIMQQNRAPLVARETREGRFGSGKDRGDSVAIRGGRGVVG